MDRNELMKLYRRLGEEYRFEAITDNSIANYREGFPLVLDLPDSLDENSKVVACVVIELYDPHSDKLNSLDTLLLNVNRVRAYCDSHLKEKGYAPSGLERSDRNLEIKYEVNVRTQDDLEKVVRDFSS